MKRKKRSFSLFSNLTVRKKFALNSIILVAAVITVWIAMAHTIITEQKSKYSQMEKTTLTASEHIMNMSVESAVSIATNIYANESVYDFLNTEYAASADYYAVYYPLQRNSALNIADTNIISKCIIYTENPTVLEGGNIKKLGDAKDSFWYRDFMKMKKPIILCVDPDTKSMVLVRKLDYKELATGESYLCLYLDHSVLTSFADDLGFNGELYVMSGSELLYSSNKKISSVSDINISQDFECLKRNYYTVDVEFYSCAEKKGFTNFLDLNKGILAALAALLIIAVTAGQLMALNIKRRIKYTLSEYESKGLALSLAGSNNGSDEIGRLLDICGEMSEKLELTGSESRQHNDSLMRKSDEFDSLFATAMRLDAEIAVRDRLPEMWSAGIHELFPLETELELLKKTADRFEADFSSDIPEGKWKVPAYSLVLIAWDVFGSLGGESVSITDSGEKAVITFEGEIIPKSMDELKINAVFEDENVSAEYSFDRNNRFNPYLRLRHCLGSRVEMEMDTYDGLKLVFRIYPEKEESDDE